MYPLQREQRGGNCSFISTRGTGASPFSGAANGVATKPIGIPTCFNISFVVGGAHSEGRMYLGEALPLSIASKMSLERGGHFLLSSTALVWYLMSVRKQGGLGIWDGSILEPDLRRLPVEEDIDGPGESISLPAGCCSGGTGDDNEYLGGCSCECVGGALF